jgi:hypothetical protein
MTDGGDRGWTVEPGTDLPILHTVLDDAQKAFLILLCLAKKIRKIRTGARLGGSRLSPELGRKHKREDCGAGVMRPHLKN